MTLSTDHSYTVDDSVNSGKTHRGRNSQDRILAFAFKPSWFVRFITELGFYNIQEIASTGNIKHDNCMQARIRIYR